MDELENAPDGGSMQKQQSNPKLSGIGKIGAIAVPVPDPPEADKAELVQADDFATALSTLAINIPLEILELDGTPVEFVYRVRKTEDLLEKGMVAQIPVLQELYQRQQDLHKLHEQLTYSYRTQKAVESLLGSEAKKEAFIQALLLASEFYSVQD